jgi:uncharacterized protein YbcI
VAVVTFLDDIEMLPNEEFLIDSGHTEMVLNVRSKYQQAIEATFRAAVERATGRRVIAVASNTRCCHKPPPARQGGRSGEDAV